MSKLQLCIEKMKVAGMDAGIIGLFSKYYEKIEKGISTQILEKEIQPVPAGSLPGIDELDECADPSSLLKKVAVLKLNGGLGTSMGLNSPKSFLPVKNGLSFIEITSQQIRTLRKTTGVEIPLILMNSMVTEDKTADYLSQNQDLAVEGIPTTFIHNSFPKILARDLSPVSWPENPKKEWNPAGHGDLYASIYSSGVLDQLILRGIEYLFVSNIDNLGATLDLKILQHVDREKLPFLLEVCRRREMDKKGGHIARRTTDGNLILRERAQTKEEDFSAFEDIGLYSYFNTNSLWISVRELKKIIKNSGGVELPPMANYKNLIPADSTSPEVIQIETAMGSALNCIQGAQAIEVGQNRFRPVKKYNDLLLYWSDRFELNENAELIEAENITSQISVELDTEYFNTWESFRARVENHIPSLKECTSLSVKGNVYFSDALNFKGDVGINAKTKEKLYLSQSYFENIENQ